MASPTKIRELRLRMGTAFATNHSNAATASWALTNAAVVKLPILAYDDSGLTHESVDDETMQTRMFARPAKIPTLRKGSLKFSMSLGGAHANVDTPTIANVIGALLGEVYNPTTTRTTTVPAGTCSAINCGLTTASTVASAGMAALVGVRGDGRGNGEARVIAGIDAGGFNVTVAWPAAPVAGDAITISTTCVPAENAAQQYIDTYSIGHGTADHRQTLDGSGKVGLSKLGANERPQVDVDLSVADHQWVQSSDRSTIGYTTAPKSASNPTVDKGLGAFFLTDASGTTRTAMKATSFAVDFGVVPIEIPDPNGINGIGGFQKVPGVPTLEATVLIDEDMPGLRDDFTAGTNKRALLQLGHVATRTALIDFQNATVDSVVSAEVNGLRAVKITLHGNESTTGGGNLNMAGVRLHVF